MSRKQTRQITVHLPLEVYMTLSEAAAKTGDAITEVAGMFLEEAVLENGHAPKFLQARLEHRANVRLMEVYVETMLDSPVHMHADILSEAEKQGVDPNAVYAKYCEITENKSEDRRQSDMDKARNYLTQRILGAGEEVPIDEIREWARSEGIRYHPTVERAKRELGGIGHRQVGQRWIWYRESKGE